MPLLRFCFLEIEYLEHVLGSHLEALIPVSDIFALIKSISNAFTIVLCQSTVLHQLNSRFITEIGRPSLGAIVHYCDLNVASILISHGYGRCDRVVVLGKCLICAILAPVSFVQIPFNHTKRIWVCKELALRIEAIEELPIDSQILTSTPWENLASVFRELYSILFNFKLDYLTQILRRKPDSDNSLLFRRRIIEQNSILL